MDPLVVPETYARAPATPKTNELSFPITPGPDIFKNSDYYFLRAIYYQQSRSWEKALTNYSKAVELAEQTLNVNEQDSTARLHLAYYLARLNQKRESLELIQTLTEEDNNLEFYLAALSYNAMGDGHKALAMLKVAIDKGYSHDEVAASPLWQNLVSNPEFKKLVE